MINPLLVQEVNDIRTSFLEVLRVLDQTPSFTALLSGSDRLREEVARLQAVGATARVRDPCKPSFTCAVVGSTGDGKTSIMAEMFPDLASRGWLLTDQTDTTAQALIVRYAPPGSPEREEVQVDSWNFDQINRLVEMARKENEDARIIARSDGTTVEVDGTEAIFATADVDNFKFGKRIKLRPLPHSYRLSPKERADPRLIATLTVKDPRQVLLGQVLSLDNQPFNAMQLRGAVKDIRLYDSFHEISRWGGCPAEQLAGLVFIDTPGLKAEGSINDEILRNVLGRKNQQIIVELLREDELDLIVHLVLCGHQSGFASLWRTVVEQCPADELADLGDRLVLAVNGMDRYFSLEPFTRRWNDPARAESEGDHFTISLETNILKKMSETGTVHPARICFLNSKRIVEAMQGPYQEFYAKARPVMEKWVQPGGVGHQTLQRLGLLDSFTKNIAALCDPADCGQGFLVRQVLEVAKENGPKLFLRKYLRRSRLHSAVDTLRKLLLRYYDAEGRLNRHAIQDVVRRCLQFLNPQDLRTVETFARQHLDQDIDRLVPGSDAQVDSARWCSDAFTKMYKFLYTEVIRRSDPPKEVQLPFAEYFKERFNTWKSQWGYRAAQLPPPSPQLPGTADLLRHSLKFHAREILYQLLMGDKAAERAKNILQTSQEQQQMAQLLARLARAVGRADTLCQQYGVPRP